MKQRREETTFEWKEKPYAIVLWWQLNSTILIQRTYGFDIEINESNEEKMIIKIG